MQWLHGCRPETEVTEAVGLCVPINEEKEEEEEEEADRPTTAVTRESDWLMPTLTGVEGP